MKKNPLRKLPFKIALCAVIAALSVVMLMLTSIIPFGTYALPGLAGAFLVIVVIELNAKWALGVFAVTSLMGFFLAGDKEAAVCYILLLGYYPILKNLIEQKIMLRVVRILLKLAAFNAAAVGTFYITTLLLAIPAEEYTLFGIYMPLAFLAAGNLVFLLYDLALTQSVVFYVRKIRGRIFSEFR